MRAQPPAIKPAPPAPQAAGIAARNVSRRTQIVILLALLGLMLLWAKWLIQLGTAWIKQAEDACTLIVRVRLFLLPLWLPGWLALAAMMLEGMRTLQHRVWPWPGRWLWKDTPILGPRQALWRGRFVLFLAGLILLLNVYLTWLALWGEVLSPELHARCAASG